MSKFKAPDGCNGISVGGEFFQVGDDGCVSVPDDGNYGSLLAPHGFTPVADKPAAGKKRTAEPPAPEAPVADKPAA